MKAFDIQIVRRCLKLLATSCLVVALLGGIPEYVMAEVTVLLGQVFPPRQNQPAPPPTPAPTVMPNQIPNGGGGPPGLTRRIPFANILGDPTKAIIQIGNMRSPVDTNFVLGRALAGRLSIEKLTSEGGNGKKTFMHVTGLSNPPIVSTEGNDLLYRFIIPILQFKTYYNGYSGEADTALSDVVAEQVVIDVRLTPTIDQRKLPTFQAVRIAITGEVKEAEKCTHFFDVIFPVNVCSLARDYFKLIKPAIENGMREMLMQPQVRGKFEQQAFYFVRAEMLSHAGINPASPAQPQITEASFQGADYVVSYVIK